MLGGYAEQGALTPRMRDVLACAARGLTALETADELHLSEATVRHIRHNACRRLEARNLAAATYKYGRAE